MKTNDDALRDAQGKMMFLVTEEWQGMAPETSYEDQAAAVSRALDSVEYIEQAINRGDVVLAHKSDNKTATIQLVAVDDLEGLNTYLKSNEAHARLPNLNRTVQPLSDWDASVEDFRKMVARAEVRADYESRGEEQPTASVLEEEVQKLLDS